MPAPRLPLRTRALAWVWTGPLGHLYGGLVDWAVLVWRILAARARAELRARVR